MVFKDIQQIVQHPQHIQHNIGFSRYRGATVFKVHTCNSQHFIAQLQFSHGPEPWQTGSWMFSSPMTRLLKLASEKCYKFSHFSSKKLWDIVWRFTGTRPREGGRWSPVSLFSISPVFLPCPSLWSPSWANDDGKLHHLVLLPSSLLCRGVVARHSLFTGSVIWVLILPCCSWIFSWPDKRRSLTFY